jgi:hypothetical protein
MISDSKFSNLEFNNDQMSEEEKRVFKMMLDAKFPQINPRYFVFLGNAPIPKMPNLDSPVWNQASASSLPPDN